MIAVSCRISVCGTASYYYFGQDLAVTQLVAESAAAARRGGRRENWEGAQSPHDLALTTPLAYHHIG